MYKKLAFAHYNNGDNMKSKKNQTIKCDVNNCSYNDIECEECTLDKIKVCNIDNSKRKEATICDSFKKR